MNLEHVCWLGGSACAGKTTIARRLAAAHGLTHYSTDAHYEAHRERVDAARLPFFHRIAQRTFSSLVTRPVEEQVTELEGFYGEEWAMVYDDLRTLPAAPEILAEGVGLLPDLLAALPGAPRALFLVATPSFRRAAYRQRGSWVETLLAQCDAPETAFERWMERDDEMARRITAQAIQQGFPVLEVDGAHDLDETVRRAADLLALPSSWN